MLQLLVSLKAIQACGHDKYARSIKTIVVDDWQYMSSFEYFDRATGERL